MGLISWILFGLIAGVIAKLLMPGDDPGGCIITVLLGVAGAAVGGYLGQVIFGAGDVTGFNVESFVTAVGGALVLLLVYRMIAGRS